MLTLRHRSLPLALAALALLGAAPVAAEEPRPNDAPLELFVQPDIVAERDEERIVGDYISGTPVVLLVRVVNVPAKRCRKGALVVSIPGDWARSVTFSFVDGDDRVVPGVEAVSLNADSAPRGGTLDLYDNEVSGQWAVTEDVTAGFEGEISLVTRWDGATARKIVLRFRKARTDDDRSRVRLGRARIRMRQRDFDAAIALLQEIRDRHGEFSDGSSSATLLPGDALAAVDRPAEALRVYEEYLDAIEQQRKGSRDEPPEAVLGRIGQVREKLRWSSGLAYDHRRRVAQRVLEIAAVGLHERICADTGKNGTLEVEFRQPSAMIAETGASWEKEKAASLSEGGLRSIWLPG